MHADPASDSLSPADARSNDVERAFFRRWLKGGSNTPYLFRELSDDDCSDFLAAAQQEPLWSTDFLSLTLRGWVLSDEQSAAAVGRSLVAIGGGEAVEIMRVRSHVETLIARGLLTEREKFGQGFVIPKVAIAQLEERGAIAMEEKAVLGVTRLLSWAHDDQPTYAALSEKVAALEAKKVAWEASPAGHWKAREKMMLTAIYHLADAHLGFDWTAFLTVAWATIGITTDDQVSAAMASLMIRLREWATRSKDVTGAIGIPVAWIWVHERGPLCGKLHTHMLLSVPRKKRALLGRVVLDHLERYSGQKLTQGSDHTPQTSPDDKEWPSGSPQIGVADFGSVTGAFSSTLHITAPRNDKTAKIFAAKRMRYMAKSIDPLTAIQLTTGARVGLADWIGIDHLADQGEFRGKRCGYSVFSLGGRRWASWAARNDVSPDLFAYRFRTYGPLDDKSLDDLAQTLRLKV